MKKTKCSLTQSVNSFGWGIWQAGWELVDGGDSELIYEYRPDYMGLSGCDVAAQRSRHRRVSPSYSMRADAATNERVGVGAPEG